jgi:predicted nucleotidyltransferase
MNPLTAGDIDLSSQQLQEIRMILSSHVPDITVWAFGSRVTGSARQYSDLDLALITVEPLPLVTKADLVDWASTSDNFRKIILANKVVIQGRGTGTF